MKSLIFLQIRKVSQNQKKTSESVNKTLHNCAEHNRLTVTFTIDHLLSKLSSNKVAVLSCWSPVDKIGLHVKYLKPSLSVGKDYLCIPLCDGIYFQGYIINIKERKCMLTLCDQTHPIIQLRK